MRLKRCLTLSVVACNLLLGANYTDWNTTNFNNGDTIAIDYNKGTNPLTQSITIQNGNVNATIQGNSTGAGIIGVFNGGNKSISGNGTIHFNIQTPQAKPAFVLQNTNFTLNSGLTLKGTNTAFQVSGGSFTLNTNANQDIDIQGGLNFTNNAKVNLTLVGNNQKIQGNLASNSSPTEVTLRNGAQITGNFTGTGGGNKFDLNVTDANSIFKGDISNTGTTKIAIKNGGKVQGKFKGTAVNRADLDLNIEGAGSTFQGDIDNIGHTILNISKAGSLNGNINARGQKLDIQLDGGNIRGNITSSTTQDNSITAKGNSSITGNISSTEEMKIDLAGSSTIAGKINIQKDAKLSLKDNAKINGEIRAHLKLDLDLNNNASIQGDIISNRETNTTLKGNSSIIGKIQANRDIKLSLEGSSHIQGQVQVGENGTITLKDTSKIQGDIQTGKKLDLDLTGNSSIVGNVASKQDAKINLNENAKINGNIDISGQSNIDLKKASQITGKITSGDQLNLNLEGTSKITGDILAQKNSTINLKENSNITGNITTKGTSKIDLKNNSSISGGVNTHAQTTISLQDSAQIKNGTSNFNAPTTITLKNNAQASNAIFNATAKVDFTFQDQAKLANNSAISTDGNSTILFKDSAQMGNSDITLKTGIGHLTFQDNVKIDSSSIKTDGGVHNILFKDNVKMTAGQIITNNGTANITAKDNADLTATITQNDGINKIDFINQAKFQGTITQNNGDSTINFKDNAQLKGEIKLNNGTTTIDFKNNAAMTGNINQTNGKSTIQFTDKTKITGDIKVQGGTTEITFTGPNAGNKTNITNAQMIGNLTAAGSNNKVTFTEGTKLTGNLTLDGFGNIDGHSQANITGAHITGFIQGWDEVDLNLQNSQVDGAIKQGGSFSQRGIKGTINQSTVLGGFEGKGYSRNDLSITDSIIKNGIQQNTGSLKIFSTGTKFYGGFKGTNSSNTLQIANGDFNQGNFLQTGGSLKAELVHLQNVNNFIGNNSNNVIHVTRTELNHLTQSGGSLNFQTDSKVKGNITGNNNSQNKISITGADIGGNLTQDSGSMEATLSNGNVQNIQASNNAKFGLYATNYKAQQITFNSAQANGASSDFVLTGAFTQNGGTSNLSFANSDFRGLINLNNTQSSSLVFTKSQIQNVQATGGNNTLNLSDGTMKNFNGRGGVQGITMTNSKAQNFDQQQGSLTLNASSQSEIQEIKSNQGNLAISLSSQSKVINNIENLNGNTTLSLQDAEVGGDIVQVGNLMIFNANHSTVKGNYAQTGGVSTTNLTHSKIQDGITFTDLTAGTLTLNQNSEIKNLKSINSTFNLNLRNESFIKQELEQVGGRIIGTLNSKSEIQGGMKLENGITSLSLYQKSKISGGITAKNNQTTLLVDDSQIDGNITITGKSLNLTAQNHSSINSPQLKLTNADLKLTLDTNSKFIGNLTQTNNKQDILIKQDSIFQGNITNTNTTSSIAINHSKITGNLTQNNGELRLDLSNQGVIEGNINLNNATTILSGNGKDNQIGGNFAQNGGNLSGIMHGLTLKGSYSQKGGDSNLTFVDSSFLKDTTIENANQSSLTFDQSKLKNYTTEGGNNTLKLLNQSVMSGDLTLKNGAKTLLKMDQSRLEGNIKGTGNSILTLDVFKSTITGSIDFNTGGIKGNAEESTIQGNIKLENTNSEVSFNKSTIGGNFEAKGGDVKLDLSKGSILQKDLLLSNGVKLHLTGSAANNQIQGKLSSTDSTLTGNISSLTLHGTFTQNQGTSDITFQDHSLFKSQVSINNAISSHLQFIDQSGIQNNINITGGNNNQITLKNQSFIKGDITTNNQSKFSLDANQSLLLGNITANAASQTDLLWIGSTLKGNITQQNGIFKLKAQDQSLLQSNLKLTQTQQANLDLFSQSRLTGNIQADRSDLTINLSSASFNSIQNPQEIKMTDSSLLIQASNQSVFGGNLIQTSTTGAHTNILNFIQSIYSGKMELTKVKTQAIFTQSKILSDAIHITKGSFDLTFDDSQEGGLIKSFKSEEAAVNITTKTKSSLQISEASLTHSILSLKAQDNSRLSINLLKLDGGTKANYEALTNGNLNLNTIIKDNASTLSVNLHGGILQGTIIQDHIHTGTITLKEDAGLGGRWAVTGDSQVQSLEIHNNAQVFEDGVSIFSSIANNRLSFVDFTMEFDDQAKSSRMGKAIIAKPQPQPNGVIPPAPPNQTYARVLHTQSLSGNGLFRVYADLGSKMADSVLAERASGEHIIQVYYRAETFREIGKDRIVVAKVNDPNTTASFKGTQSDIGLTRYNTEIIKENAQNGGFEWIIGQATPAGLSYASKIIASILQTQYRLFSIETDSLDRRLGGLEKIQRDKGFWVRSFFGQASKKALSYSIDEKDTYYSFWTGFDYNSIGLTGHNFLGTFFNYTGMNTESAAYLGKSSSFAVGFYNVFKAFSGFYFDVLAKYIYSMSSFDISSYALSKNKPEINNHKFLANLEIGQTFYIGEKHKSLYIQPQFQITGGYIQGNVAQFIDVSGERIQASIGHNAPAMMRMGVFVGQSFGENIRFNIKGGSSFAYDVNSGGELIFKDSSNTFQTYQKGDFRMLLSAHADLIFGESFRLYTSVDTSFFGNYNTVFNVNVGLRLVFGKRNNIVPEVPMVYNPYQPPQIPQVELEQRTIPVVKTYTTRDIDANYIGKKRNVSSLIPGNPNVSPATGYVPQPITRRSYRDPSTPINPELKENQQ